MKYKLLFYVACLVSLNISAQKFDAHLFGAIQNSLYTIIPNDDGYIAIQIMNDNVSGSNWNKYRVKATLLRYDQDMQLVKENKLSDGKNMYSAFYYALKKIGDKFYFIYIEPSSKNNIGNLMALNVNPVTLKTSAPKMLASSAEMSLSLPLFDGMSQLNVFSHVSADQRHAFVLISTGKDKYYICNFNENLNVEWTKKGKDGYIENEIQDAAIDNNGNVYLSYIEKSKGFIVGYSKEKSPVKVMVPFETALPVNLLMIPDKLNENLIIVGTYSDGNDYLAGVFKTAASLKTDFRFNKIEKHVFPAEIVDQLDKDGWANSKKGKRYGVMENFHPKLFISEDGAINMLGEFQALISTQRNAYNASGSIMNINFKKETPSFTRIPKYRISAGSTIGEGYYAIPYRNKMIVFYNDYIQNLQRDVKLGANKSNNYSNVILVAAIIDEDGNLNRQSVVDMKDQNYVGILKFIHPGLKNCILIPFQKVANQGRILDDKIMYKLCILE